MSDSSARHQSYLLVDMGPACRTVWLFKLVPNCTFLATEALVPLCVNNLPKVSLEYRAAGIRVMVVHT